jgi:hypothetical protein
MNEASINLGNLIMDDNYLFVKVESIVVVVAVLLIAIAGLMFAVESAVYAKLHYSNTRYHLWSARHSI